jgi:hypothetical protein
MIVEIGPSDDVPLSIETVTINISKPRQGIDTHEAAA